VAAHCVVTQLLGNKPRKILKCWLCQHFKIFLGLGFQVDMGKKNLNPKSSGARAACATAFWV